jgi:hypothetical protein
LLQSVSCRATPRSGPRKDLSVVEITYGLNAYSIPLLLSVETKVVISSMLKGPRTPAPSRSPIQLIRTNGTLSYQDLAALAGRMGGRLPSQAECISFSNDAYPSGYMADFDLWLPILDSDNDWISLGNYDPLTRYKKTHKELFGPPVWGTDSGTFHPWRVIVAVVTMQPISGSIHPSRQITD